MIFRFALSNPVYGTQILTSDPEGWEEMILELNRDEQLHGLFLEYSLSLKFFCGAGKEYIDQIYEEFGIDGEMTIAISVACGCTPGTDSLDYSIDYSDDYGTPSEGCEYEVFFDGIINLSTYATEPNFTSVNIEQASIYSKLKNRIDTKVDLTASQTLDGGVMNDYSFAPYEMTLHSKKIVFISTWEPNPPSNSVNITDVIEHAPPLDLITIDIPGSQSSFYVISDPTSAIIQNLIGEAQDITISGTLNFTTLQTFIYTEGGGSPSPPITIGKGYTYYLDILDENFVFISSVVLSTETSVATSTPVMVSFSFSETLNVPSLYFVRLRYSMDNIDFSPYNPPLLIDGKPVFLSLDLNYVYSESTNVQAVIESVVAASPCKVFAIHEALALVTQFITDDSDPIRSNYYGRKNSEPCSYTENGCGSFMSITNGLQIRQYPLGEKPPSVSLKELYFSLDAIDNLGLGIEKEGEEYKVRIDPKYYFYDKSVSVTLSNVPNLKMAVAADYYYNNVTVGFEKWENEEINGIDEFNSKRQYTLGLKTIPATDDVLSKLVASGYALEFARRKKYTTNATEDYKYDNDIFIICLNRTVSGTGEPNNLTTAEKDENFTDISNLISPETSYNLRLSPVRNLLRRSNIINPSILKYPGKEIKFTYGEGNFSMQSTEVDDCPGSYGSASLRENQNIVWDSVDNSDNELLWVPEIYEFAFPLTFQQYKTVRDNPYKCIQFSAGEDYYIKGFILELRYKVLSGMTEFKLLRAWE